MTSSWRRFISGGWTGQPWTANAWRGARIDPYLVWADATDFADLGGIPRKWAPVVLEVQDTSAARFARAMRSKPWIRVSPFYRHPPKGLEETTFCTATVTREFFAELKTLPLARLVDRFELGLAVRSSVDPFTHGTARADGAIAPGNVGPHPERNRPPAVMGIIDDGLAFAHGRFRERDGRSTRIEYFCDQGYGALDSTRPDYGRELTKKDIDGYMRAATHGSMVDEDAVYRMAGYLEVREQLEHGTHVMDLLCGSYPAEVKRTSPRIISVQIQLPSRRTRDTSGRSLSLHALNAMRYILDRADCIARDARSRPCPVVVNLSYGNIAGPHDGSAMLEEAIDELIDRRGRLSVVIAAGNSHLTRCHSKFSLERNAERLLTWRILPDDATPSFLEIWLPHGNPEPEVAIEITPPWGGASGWIRKNQVHTWQTGRDVQCTAVHLGKVATGDRRMILVATAPSTTLDQNRTAAPSGDWRIRVRNVGARKIDSIDAWVQRDDTPFLYRPRGRQSRFDDKVYELYDYRGRPVEVDNTSDIKRAGTVNAIATGRNTVVIGGFRSSDGKPALYSAKGARIRLANGRFYWNGPDAMTVSDVAPAFPGVLASGTRSRSVTAMNGTSVAAPQIARTLMRVAAKRKPTPSPGPVIGPGSKPPRTRKAPDSQPDRKAVQELAANQEKTRPRRARKPDAALGGAGRIQLPPRVSRLPR